MRCARVKKISRKFHLPSRYFTMEERVALRSRHNSVMLKLKKRDICISVTISIVMFYRTGQKRPGVEIILSF